MPEYAFPCDLLEGIKFHWQTLPNQPFPLPEDRILQKLLETCYHASLRTSEKRAVQCVVAYASMEDFPEGSLHLDNRPVLLTDAELVRLAPVTQRHQTVIGCQQNGDELWIWGFFDYGHAWVQHTSGDPPAVPVQSTDFPPDCLTVAIEGPGALTISRGRCGLVRLRDGRISFPQENLLQHRENPLGRFFHQLIKDLVSSAEDPDVTTPQVETEGQRPLLTIYTSSILAILERIRLRHHGGSLVITRVPFTEQFAHITYKVSEHAGLADEIMAYKTLDDSLREPHTNLDLSLELARSRTELELHRMSRKLIRGINQVSLLAAVDGAVLLDDHLRIQGFGVRFPLLLSPGAIVGDALTGKDYMCDQWGLRHQSIFSVCQRCDQAIGLIVSQDGEVKAVHAVGGQLFFWDGILN